MNDARGRGRSSLKHSDGAGLLWVGLNEGGHAVSSKSADVEKASSFLLPDSELHSCRKLLVGRTGRKLRDLQRKEVSGVNRREAS